MQFGGYRRFESDNLLTEKKPENLPVAVIMKVRVVQ